MKRSFYLLPVVLLIASCSGRNAKTDTDTSLMYDADSSVCASIEGEWLLEHVVVNDTLEVRPADINSEAMHYAYFYNDSTFNFQTGCNAIGGRYIQAGDSIVFNDMLWTEMACENMQVEELLRNALPKVSIVDWTNDSIVRLNSGSSEYVVLKKSSR